MLLELKRNSFHGKLFSVSAFKKKLRPQQNRVPPQHSPASPAAHLTSHMVKFYVPQWFQRPQLALKQSSLHTLQSEGQREIPRRLHISTSPKLHAVHLSHHCLRQASPYLLHSKGYRNLLFHSQ